MSEGIRVKPVRFFIVEIAGVSIAYRQQPGKTIKVNDWYRPDIAGLPELFDINLREQL